MTKLSKLYVHQSALFSFLIRVIRVIRGFVFLQKTSKGIDFKQHIRIISQGTSVRSVILVVSEPSGKWWIANDEYR